MHKYTQIKTLFIRHCRTDNHLITRRLIIQIYLFWVVAALLLWPHALSLSVYISGSKTKLALLGRVHCGKANFGPVHVLPPPLKWRNPRRKTRPRLETHRQLIGQVTPSWPSLTNSGAVRGDDSRATQLNTHHVAHMYRVEVATPHPDRQPRLGACAEVAACVTAVLRAKWHRRPPVAPLLRSCWHVRDAVEAARPPALRRLRSRVGLFCFSLLLPPLSPSSLSALICSPNVARTPLLSWGTRGVCWALKMGLFLHAVGSVPPTESAAERVRLSPTRPLPLPLSGLLA